MLLFELLDGVGEYTLYDISADSEISSPFTDTASAICGGLFVCIEGALFDGHDFAKEAYDLGAAAVVAKKPIVGVPTVKVKDTRFAAAVIWNNYFKKPTENMN